MRLPGSASIAIALLLAAHPARADERRLLVRYQVVAGCPDLSSFAQSLTERTGPRSIEPSSAPLPDVDVSVREEAGVFRGSIEVATRDGRQHRNIDGESCADLVSALAFSAALLLEAGSQEPVAKPPSPARAPGADLRTPPEPAAPGRWRWSAGARFEASAVLESGWTFGPAVFVDVARERRSPLSPSARLALSYAVSEVESARGPARLKWYMARLGGCPLRLGGDTFGFCPCVAIGAGAIHGEGDVAQPESETGAWAEVDLGARARAVLFERLLLEVEGLAIVPLSRYRLLFRDPEEEIQRIRSVGAGVAIGAGAVF